MVRCGATLTIVTLNRATFTGGGLNRAFRGVTSIMVAFNMVMFIMAGLKDSYMQFF